MANRFPQSSVASAAEAAFNQVVDKLVMQNLGREGAFQGLAGIASSISFSGEASQGATAAPQVPNKQPSPDKDVLGV